MALGAEYVSFPIAKVERILEVAADAIEGSGGEAFSLIDDEPVPVINLADQLGLGSDADRDPVPLVLAEVRGERVALRVDRFAGQQEIYLKPLPELLVGVRALAGLTVLDDGRPVFLLDLNHVA